MERVQEQAPTLRVLVVTIVRARLSETRDREGGYSHWQPPPSPRAIAFG